MSFFLVFLAIVLVGAVLWASLGRRPRRSGHRPLPALLDGGFEQPPANLPPVLLPANAAPEDVDRVRFSLGLRGYRMDQVDQVLDVLRDQLAARRQEVEELRARLLAFEEPGGGSPGGDSDGERAEVGDGGNALPGKGSQ
ncbi:DivIVA domain-containing protein [Pseudarthrobacter sp. NS4]|uniref:DivIVA domain-containing protein n=1 Tax=Pseudarthrobacter sp. NS4 TaxID=2973976 RepID=UPI002162F6D8|nr:DivIVA domain-containing protein [Pseudarthrobacter sp. NS4]